VLYKSMVTLTTTVATRLSNFHISETRLYILSKLLQFMLNEK